MSDQGFHEVQLSGKQLVFLFMSAVVLAVVVFLLGVNVGQGVRSAVGDTESTAVEATVPETLVPADPAVGEKTEKPAEPELSYHEMLVGSATPPPAVAEVAPPKPDATQTALPPAAAAPVAAAPIAGAGDWFLQMGAYSTRGVADSQVEKLKQLSVPAFVLVPGAGSADKLFKVRVGPYKDRAEAEQVKIRLERQGTSSRITR